MLRRQKGFTLIELLIVIAIIGILAAIAIPMYQAQTVRARLSEVTNAISHVASAAGAFRQDMEYWPTCGNIAEIATSLGVTLPTRRLSDMTAGTVNGMYEITATIANISTANPTVDNCTLTLRADTAGDGAIKWIWTDSGGSPVAAAFRPKG